jgi:hypothetical protein
MFLCLKLPCINSVRCEREALRLIPCWTEGEANLGGQNSGSLLPTNFALRRNKNKHKPRNNQNVFERKWSSARFKVTSCAFSVSIFYFRSPRFVSSVRNSASDSRIRSCSASEDKAEGSERKEYETTLAQHESVTEFGVFSGSYLEVFLKHFVSFSCMRAWHWGFLI